MPPILSRFSQFMSLESELAKTQETETALSVIERRFESFVLFQFIGLQSLRGVKNVNLALQDDKFC